MKQAMNPYGASRPMLDDPSIIANAVRIARRERPVMKNPQVAGMQDIITQDIFDTAVFAAGATLPPNTPMFTVPASATKADTLTNMTQASQLQAPWRLWLEAIAIIFKNDIAPDDAFNIGYNVLGQLVIGTKEMWRGILVKAGAGCGVTVPSVALISGQTAAAAAANKLIYTTSNGVPVAANVLVLDRPFMIEQNEQIRFNLQPGGTVTLTAAGPAPAFGTGATIQVCLHGQLYRQVQ